MRFVRTALALLLLALGVTSCGGRSAPPASTAPVAAEKSAPPAAAKPRPATEIPGEGPLVVFLGDSLTAGLGLDEDQAYPALVGRELARRGLPVRVVNAGVSGDTSAGGLARLDWLLAQHPDLLVVELGANDGLRGQPLTGIEANLRAIVERARAAGVGRIVLAGMKIPPNYGPEYAAGFDAIFPRVASGEKVTLIPFLLEGVAGRPELNQPDGLHPNAAGDALVARTVVDALAPLVERLRPRVRD